MVYRFETFRGDKGMVVLQSQKVSQLSVIPNRFYKSPKWKNWMCELCMFSQIQSHMQMCLLLSQCNIAFDQQLLCACVLMYILYIRSTSYQFTEIKSNMYFWQVIRIPYNVEYIAVSIQQVECANNAMMYTSYKMN